MTNEQKEVSTENKETVLKDNKKSTISELGNIGIALGDKVGKIFTEFFVGKQPTKEEKEARALKKSRQKQLISIQEEVQFQKDMELAKQGKYVPPVVVEKKVESKKKEPGIFDNIGKYNPIKDFEQNKSLGTTDFGLSVDNKKTGNKSGFSEDMLKIRNTSGVPDFGLDGFSNPKNPMRQIKEKK